MIVPYFPIDRSIYLISYVYIHNNIIMFVMV